MILRIFWALNLTHQPFGAIFAFLIFQLKSSVGNVKLLFQFTINGSRNFTGAADHLVLNQDMRRERVNAGCNCPDMQVMQFHHSPNSIEGEPAGYPQIP